VDPARQQGRGAEPQRPPTAITMGTSPMEAFEGRGRADVQQRPPDHRPRPRPRTHERCVESDGAGPIAGPAVGRARGRRATSPGRRAQPAPPRRFTAEQWDGETVRRGKPGGPLSRCARDVDSTDAYVRVAVSPSRRPSTSEQTCEVAFTPPSTQGATEEANPRRARSSRRAPRCSPGASRSSPGASRCSKRWSRCSRRCSRNSKRCSRNSKRCSRNSQSTGARGSTTTNLLHRPPRSSWSASR